MSETLSEILVCDDRRPGIELIEFHGACGYDDERLTLGNGLGNGLRFLVHDEECCAHFHINDPKTARFIAHRLLQFCERIAHQPEAGKATKSKT